MRDLRDAVVAAHGEAEAADRLSEQSRRLRRHGAEAAHLAPAHPRVHARSRARAGAALLIVDVQERLFPTMDADHREEVMRNINVLVATARRLRQPVVVTEQYPKDLGHTLLELGETLG